MTENGASKANASLLKAFHMRENMEIKYKIIDKNNFNEEYSSILAKMLKQQGKVIGPFDEKLSRCESICIAWVDDDVAAIGAIKEKTPSDFSVAKAGIPDLLSDFDSELGYFYTKKKYTGKGMASMIAKLLIREFSI